MQQKKILKKIKQYFLLGRYHKPYGSFLLMWPCFWGVSYKIDLSIIDIKLFILFLIGSFFMRGAGCTINDIIDVNFDRKIKRTKDRPIANNKITKREAYIFLLFQSFIGFLVLINFNIQTIILAFSIIPLVILYPFFKRFSYYPQFVLGLIFNWGVLIGNISTGNPLNLEIILIYLAGVFLTIGYDTIYAYQDLEEDINIGLKSFAIKTKNNPKIYILFIYFISFLFFSIAFLKTNPSNLISILSLIFIFSHLIYQFSQFEINNNNSLHKTFVSNTYLGGIIFVGLILKNNFYL